jgi:hypothetical protein
MSDLLSGPIQYAPEYGEPQPGPDDPCEAADRAIETVHRDRRRRWRDEDYAKLFKPVFDAIEKGSPGDIVAVTHVSGYSSFLRYNITSLGSSYDEACQMNGGVGMCEQDFRGLRMRTAGWRAGHENAADLIGVNWRTYGDEPEVITFTFAIIPPREEESHEAEDNC